MNHIIAILKQVLEAAWLQRKLALLGLMTFVLACALTFVLFNLRWMAASVSAFAVPIAILLACTVLAILLWKLPKWQVASLKGLDPKDRSDRENEARKTTAQILGGLAFLVTLYSTMKTLTVSQETLRLSQEGQITDRFTKAIAQLGDEQHLAIRLGGIYALERIARDSERDHWPVMEILTAYIRDHRPWKQKGAKAHGDSEVTVPLPELDEDIKAILTVIGRREWWDKEFDTLNLRSVDIRTADLRCLARVS